MSASAIGSGLVVFYDLEIVVAAAKEIKIVLMLTKAFCYLDFIHTSEETEIAYIRGKIFLAIVGKI